MQIALPRYASRRNLHLTLFKATFYKLAGGKKKSVRRRKPGSVIPGHGSPDHILKAGLHFIRIAGGVEAARERLVGLEQLIETAKEVD
jgi:hypothetical protein